MNNWMYLWICGAAVVIACVIARIIIIRDRKRR